MTIQNHAQGLSRRRLAVASLGGLAGASVLGVSKVAAQRGPGSGGGVTGGGTVSSVDGTSEAHFSVFGSQFTNDETDEVTIFGKLRVTLLTEAETGTLIESTEISEYGPDPEQDNARLMTGSATINGEGGEKYFFSVRLEVAGDPGSGESTFSLEVTEGSSESPATILLHEVSGNLSTGDLTLLAFDFGA
jgi:hypothetical protein